MGSQTGAVCVCGGGSWVCWGDVSVCARGVVLLWWAGRGGRQDTHTHRAPSSAHPPAGGGPFDCPPSPMVKVPTRVLPISSSADSNTRRYGMSAMRARSHSTCSSSSGVGQLKTGGERGVGARGGQRGMAVKGPGLGTLNPKHHRPKRQRAWSKSNSSEPKKTSAPRSAASTSARRGSAQGGGGGEGNGQGHCIHAGHTSVRARTCLANSRPPPLDPPHALPLT